MKATYIREMYPEDVPEAAKIERLSFSTPWSEASFYSEIYSRHSITKVAEINGTVIGYICVSCIADESQILNLAVHPNYRKQGIATMLLSEIIEEVTHDGYRFIYLEVRASNYPGRRLYEKFGFKTVGIRRNYYLDPAEDAIIMRLEL